MDRPISKKARKAIEFAIDLLFERAKARLLGPEARKRDGKFLAFKFVPELTLSSLFTAASREEGVKEPNYDLLTGLLSIAESYLDAQKEKAKAQTVQAVQSFIQDAHVKGVKTDINTVLGGQLAELWGKVTDDVKTIVETEATIARNMGIDDAIQRLSAMAGIDDPTVLFVVVRDGHRCEECTRLHLMPDGITPRLWKRSQVKTGYHKRGEKVPSVGGLHPHCRCVMAVLMPGYGFDSSGLVVWKAKDYDAYAEQQSTL
jgi:hypothetical protein